MAVDIEREIGELMALHRAAERRSESSDKRHDKAERRHELAEKRHEEWEQRHEQAVKDSDKRHEQALKRHEQAMKRLDRNEKELRAFIKTGAKMLANLLRAQRDSTFKINALIAAQQSNEEIFRRNDEQFKNLMKAILRQNGNGRR